MNTSNASSDMLHESRCNRVNGIHAQNTFNFNFEQIIELTRTSASLIKKLAPDAAALIG